MVDQSKFNCAFNWSQLTRWCVNILWQFAGVAQPTSICYQFAFVVAFVSTMANEIQFNFRISKLSMKLVHVCNGMQFEPLVGNSTFGEALILIFSARALGNDKNLNKLLFTLLRFYDVAIQKEVVMNWSPRIFDKLRFLLESLLLAGWPAFWWFLVIKNLGLGCSFVYANLLHSAHATYFKLPTTGARKISIYFGLSLFYNKIRVFKGKASTTLTCKLY